MAPVDQHPGVRPRPSLGRQIDRAARAVVPACSTLLLMLLVAAPLGIAARPALLPAMMVVCVWFWSLVQPALLPPLVVFLIGLLLDLIGNLPPGVGVLALLGCHGAALALRRFLTRGGFVRGWLAFVPVAGGAALLIWLLVMLMTFRLLPPDPAIFQTALAIAVYPLLAVPLAAAHRLITSSAHGA